MTDEAEVLGPPDLLEAVEAADDDKARTIELLAVDQTDNGWVEGDPEEQPENPDPWTDEGDLL